MKQVARFFRGNRGAAVGAVWTLIIILVAIAAPYLATHDPLQVNLRDRLMSPGTEHWLGTDEVGRDLFSRAVWGARVSLIVGLSSTGIGLLVGGLLGLLAGYFGGLLDQILMRIIDIMLSFPFLLLALALVATLGTDLKNIVVAVGIAAVPTYARLVRGSVLSVRHREFVEAAQALGASHARIIGRHIVTNVLGPVIVMATLNVSTAMLIEANLSFLGLGDPTQPSWGTIVSEGRKYLREAPWIATVGGLAITLTVIALNLLGDGLRDRLDPRLMRQAGPVPSGRGSASGGRAA